MSRIYFHAKDGEAEVRGSERAHMGHYISSFAKIKLEQIYESGRWEKDVRGFDLEKVREYGKELAFNTILNGFTFDDVLIWEDKLKEMIPAFSWALNRVWEKGADPSKFVCRVHGQCELHGYVAKENYQWLADIIQKGLNTDVLRSHITVEKKPYSTGWDSVLELLNTTKSSHIVMSYSVCEGFPNAHYIGEPDGMDIDTYYYEVLSDEQRWDIALGNLLQVNNGLEMKPDDWEEFYFM